MNLWYFVTVPAKRLAQHWALTHPFSSPMQTSADTWLKAMTHWPTLLADFDGWHFNYFAAITAYRCNEQWHWQWASVVGCQWRLLTRKLCSCKDDRAMRPIWCPENVHDSLTTPTATIPNIFHGLLFRSTLWMFLQNLKYVALPVPEIIGGTQKIGQSMDTPTLPFLQNF